MFIKEFVSNGIQTRLQLIDTFVAHPLQIGEMFMLLSTDYLMSFITKIRIPLR